MSIAGPAARCFRKGGCAGIFECCACSGRQGVLYSGAQGSKLCGRPSMAVSTSFENVHVVCGKTVGGGFRLLPHHVTSYPHQVDRRRRARNVVAESLSQDGPHIHSRLLCGRDSARRGEQGEVSLASLLCCLGGQFVKCLSNKPKRRRDG